MDSLRSIHARVAALSRFRSPDDPDVAKAREDLARCKEETRVLRARIGSLPPSACAQLLTSPERAAAGV
jgi:hypothetical protein